jgi:hypothetical protein
MFTLIFVLHFSLPHCEIVFIIVFISFSFQIVSPALLHANVALHSELETRSGNQTVITRYCNCMFIEFENQKEMELRQKFADALMCCVCFLISNFECNSESI